MAAVDPDIISRMVSNEADMAYRRRVLTIFEWLKPSDTDLILDGGCGRGFYLNYIDHMCRATTVGVELNLPVAGIARTSLRPSARLVNGSLYHLPFPDNTFDKAILSEVLEHVDNDVLALRAVARVLRNGGLVAITVPNASYPFWWDPINRVLENVLHRHIRTGVFAGIWANHVRLYSMSALNALVASAGLELVDSRSFTHHSFPFIHNIVYGFGKTLLEANLLPPALTGAASRYNTDGRRGSTLNPINIGLSLFGWFDRRNSMNEPPERSTVNLCVLARKPAHWS